jgi:Ca2+-binding RTX toxin-like protein
MRRSLLLVLVLVVALVFAAPAAASYKAKVAGGTLTLTGNKKGDKLTLRLKKHAAGTLQVDVGANGSVDFAFKRSGFAAIVVNAGAGNDTVTISEKNGIFTTLENTSIFGGPGLDRLTGGTGAESFVGGPGKDIVNGKSGDDVFFWNSGDGSDKIDGALGGDAVTVTGAANVNDDFVLSGNGLRASLAIFPATLDLGGVEHVTHVPLAGFDQVAITNLAGSGVTLVDVDLGVAGGGDTNGDEVVIFGTDGPDFLQALAAGGAIEVTGGGAHVNVAHSEVGDLLTLFGLAGDDTISAGTLSALAQLSVDAGDGNDIVNGGNGADTLGGGPGNDTIDGNQGVDAVFLGAGTDTARWDPGDGSDLVEGEEGDDLLLFNGSAGSEIFAASNNGGRLLFTRNVGNIVMDVGGVEELDLNALGGADTGTINDLTPTGVERIDVDLGVAAAGDGAADAFTVNGTAGVDVFSIAGSGGSVSFLSFGLAATLAHAEPANDTLTVNGSSGADLFSASGLAATSLGLTLNGGNENDILVGSSGADTLNGDAGNDDITAGDGNDTIDGGANTDECDGGAGIDTAANCETVVNVP